jgi:hypothetical protein
MLDIASLTPSPFSPKVHRPALTDYRISADDRFRHAGFAGETHLLPQWPPARYRACGVDVPHRGPLLSAQWGLHVARALQVRRVGGFCEHDADNRRVLG